MHLTVFAPAPPPPKKKKIGITLVFHFSREQCITAVQRETENNAYANFSGGNKVHYHGRCASGEREEKIKFWRAGLTKLLW